MKNFKRKGVIYYMPLVIYKGKGDKMPKQLFTKENAAEKGRKGGIKSGETRRRQREIKDIAKTLMAMKVKRGVLEDYDSLEDAKGKNVTAAESMFIMQMLKGMKGDTKATEFCFKASDLMPDQKVNIEAEVSDNTGYLDSIQNQLIDYRNVANFSNEEKDTKKDE